MSDEHSEAQWEELWEQIEALKLDVKDLEEQMVVMERVAKQAVRDIGNALWELEHI